jgi:hypothetical protein
MAGIFEFMKEKCGRQLQISMHMFKYLMTVYFSRRFTFLDFLAKFGTGLILLAPTVYLSERL